MGRCHALRYGRRPTFLNPTLKKRLDVKAWIELIRGSSLPRNERTKYFLDEYVTEENGLERLQKAGIGQEEDHSRLTHRRKVMAWQGG